jgi:hypothetical protein
LKVMRGSPGYPGHEVEIESLAVLLNETVESVGAGGGVIIGALTMVLAVWLDRAPEPVANEIRRRVVSVLEGKIGAGI